MRQACGFPGAEIARRARSFPFLFPVLFVTSGVTLAWPAPARARHIFDGVLPMGWALLVAMVFLLSAMPIPVPFAGFAAFWLARRLGSPSAACRATRCQDRFAGSFSRTRLLQHAIPRLRRFHMFRYGRP